MMDTVIRKYRSKPKVVKALLFNGDNAHEIEKFCGSQCVINLSGNPMIRTMEGIMNVSIGDYVVLGTHGEFYPCKPEPFKRSYELVGTVNE